MINRITTILLFMGLGFCSCEESSDAESQKCIVYGTPPFDGTIFIDPDIITPSDPTAFVSLDYSGQGLRTMYDRRINDWINISPYLFTAQYIDSLNFEIQVNPEFGSPEAAQVQAEKYAEVIGRLTTELRKDVETVWIHKGLEPFGGGNNNLLIHTDLRLKIVLIF